MSFTTRLNWSRTGRSSLTSAFLLDRLGHVLRRAVLEVRARRRGPVGGTGVGLLEDGARLGDRVVGARRLFLRQRRPRPARNSFVGALVGALVPLSHGPVVPSAALL